MGWPRRPWSLPPRMHRAGAARDRWCSAPHVHLFTRAACLRTPLNALLASSPVVPMLGTARGAVAHRDVDDARPREMIEVAARRHAAHAGRLRDLARGDVGIRLTQCACDEGERRG